ncbi:RNA polymerase sigma factor [Mucilaginibacter myungsuensis]|uniref:RNA polymerase sigma factor n=1 Tax=Mucilaginibacter myungsuensis TaxID=649104 RepID=A0A929L2N7_9SPHI|nr:RNA polymerase sigma factor [Mucilaginibacter myungsuensis]MBE9662116.1 RNA polymerase sigma factor [Mucilaginibacter myungsuensis]MDN3599450.1 RNA polymerase sigma factor [Mucilaginibacter myungsuensis]
MKEEQLRQLIDGCIRQDRKSQKEVYKAFYSFAMHICLRYAADRDEAAGLANEGFFKAFTKINSYDVARPFRTWLGRIMTNVAIDHYRANLKMAYNEDLDQAIHLGHDEVASARLNYNDLLDMVQRLPRSYRTVFNLYAIDGYTHEEIGELLDISPGTSKSCLFKARAKLKQWIQDSDAPAPGKTYGSAENYLPIVAFNGAMVPPRDIMKGIDRNETGYR